MINYNPKTIEELSEIMLDIDRRLRNAEGRSGRKISHDDLADISDHNNFLKNDGSVIALKSPLDMGDNPIINATNPILNAPINTGEPTLAGLSIASNPIQASITTSAFQVNGNIEIPDGKGYLSLGRIDNTHEGGELRFLAASTYHDWTVDSFDDTLRHVVNWAGTSTAIFFNLGAGKVNLLCDGVIRADIGFNINGTPGANFNGVVTNITVVNGIVTAAS